MSETPPEMPDHLVAEFLDMAQSAHIYFDIINDRLTMRAVNPIWEMWMPFRHLLDEIGAKRIEAYLRNTKQPERRAA